GIVDHDSAWRAGEQGARFGLMIPGHPKVGDKFYQELAPKIAMDRVEIVSTDDTVGTPAGTFEHCLHLKETTPLEGDVSHKWYAPGIGIVKDDDFELAKKPQVTVGGATDQPPPKLRRSAEASGEGGSRALVRSLWRSHLLAEILWHRLHQEPGVEA